MCNRLGYGIAAGVIAALALTACGGSGGGTSPANSGASNSDGSSGGATTAACTSGTGLGTGSGADTAVSATETDLNGNTRAVQYFIPNPAPSICMPVVIFLPYQSGTPASMATLTRASRLADQYGVFVAIPAPPPGGQWNDNPASPTLANTDDVGFIAKLIADLTSNYSIDSSRIYLAGYSNSGFMATRFACERSSLISGIALVGATIRGQVEAECGSVRPQRVVMFNGTADKVTPYGGELDQGLLGQGSFFVIASSPHAEQIWETHDGCSSAGRSTQNLPTTVNDGTSVTLTRNTSCSGNSAVALYTINNGGHTWPGNQVNGLVGTFNQVELGTTTQNLDATLVLWQFFAGS